MYRLKWFLAILLVVGFVIATTGAAKAEVPKEIEELAKVIKCTIIQTLIPLVTMVLFVLAGISYALGGLFGAEVRARAHGYATALLVGAFIGFLLWAFADTAVGAMWPAYKAAPIKC